VLVILCVLFVLFQSSEFKICPVESVINRIGMQGRKIAPWIH